MYKKYYLLTGKIQGIGFRFFVEEIAQKMNIKGYIKNLDNGKVEIVAFIKNKEDINIFEHYLKEGNGYSKIKKMDIEELNDKYQFDFKNFKIYH